MTKRLFVGLELPANCRETLAGLDPHVKGVRWLHAEQMHLTMSFLGPVDPAKENRLRDTLAGVRVPPFFLPIQGVGVFGGSRPTVVWAGVGQGHPHLYALHKHIQDAVLRAEIEADLRPFHPHITMGRARNVSRAALLPFLRKRAETEFGLAKISTFVLFSSVLAPHGATHLLEMQWPLALKN